MPRFFAVVLFAFSTLVQAQTPLHTDLALSYLEQASTDSRDKPLIIFLHGYGSNEQDLFGIKDALPKDYNYLSVRAPVQLQPGAYQWFTKKPQSSEYDGVTVDLKGSGQLLAQFIGQATEKYHAQPAKVFLVGFSQGAIMSYEVALRQPQLLGGIAPLSGKLLPVLRSELKPTPALEKLAVFIGHGTSDARLPFSGATDADTFLKTLAITPQFHAYQGVGHTIALQEVVDLKMWLATVVPK